MSKKWNKKKDSEIFMYLSMLQRTIKQVGFVIKKCW